MCAIRKRGAFQSHLGVTPQRMRQASHTNVMCLQSLPGNRERFQTDQMKAYM